MFVALVPFRSHVSDFWFYAEHHISTQESLFDLMG